MTGFADQLLQDFDLDLQQAAVAAASEFVEMVKVDSATPRDTGNLAGGIQADPPQGSRGRITIEVRSTARSDSGADVGTILDRSTGRLVEAAAYGHQAFGPISPPAGGMRFLRSFRVTTKHVGWWDQATRHDLLDSALDQFSRFDL